MLSWVAKVGPQLPEPPPTKLEVQNEVKPAATKTTTTAAPKKVTFQDECTTEAPKAADKPKQEVQPTEGSSSSPGVLGWISSALPQPAVSPKLKRTNSTIKEENTTTSNPENQKGMIAWIAQGLEKVVPQPDLKSKESAPTEQTTEVSPAAAAVSAPPAAEPVKPPQTSTKEPEPEEKPENKPYPPSMMEWIKQGLEKVVPQPEFRSNTDAKDKTETPAAAKAAEASAASKASADSEKSSKAAEQQPKMMDWIASGIGRILPQPVQRQGTVQEEEKEKAKDEVQKRGKETKGEGGAAQSRSH